MLFRFFADRNTENVAGNADKKQASMERPCPEWPGDRIRPGLVDVYTRLTRRSTSDTAPSAYAVAAFALRSHRPTRFRYSETLLEGTHLSQLPRRRFANSPRIAERETPYRCQLLDSGIVHSSVLALSCDVTDEQMIRHDGSKLPHLQTPQNTITANSSVSGPRKSER